MPPAAQIRTMFDRIAPRYDLANRVISMGVDTVWRRRAIRASGIADGQSALDVCCGTGDMTFALARRTSSTVVGADFSPVMLEMADRRHGRKAAGSVDHVRFVEADAMQLPFDDDSFDVLTVSFGVRNVERIEQAFAEFQRVVRPGGRIVVMEFTRPRNRFFRGFYGVWFERIVPVIGGLVTGDREAYTYLPSSVRQFPEPGEIGSLLEGAGMESVRWRLMGGGIVALHTALAGSAHGAPGPADGPPPEGST